MANLAAITFEVLRNLFFDNEGNPVEFTLREKRNTQDDPFDEYLSKMLDVELKKYGVRCQKSSGPLISPDLAIYAQEIDMKDPSVQNNPEAIIGVEVKKLEQKNKKIARGTGLDYNSTPPCGKIKIYNEDNESLIIKSFYLFAGLAQTDKGKYFVSAMTLCDGSIINDDFELYSNITGAREKGINLGTYGDGANRNRPMVIFSNPLGTELLDGKISLISGLDLSAELVNIGLRWKFIRKDVNQKDHVFFVYLDRRDMKEPYEVAEVREPFHTPAKRDTKTQGRGKFKLIVK